MPSVDDVVALPPTRYAELVAPAISRAFVSGMRPDERLRRIVEDHGGAAVGFLIDLRNPLAAGAAVSRADLGNLYRYSDPDEIDATMDRTVEGGLLSEQAGEGYRATAAGHRFLDALRTAQGEALVERWGPMAHLVHRLNTLLEAVLAEASSTGGPTFRLQRPYEPDGTPAELLLLNRLSWLRCHRADAHAAAWTAAGMTASEVQAEPWGAPWSDRRQQVERRTNELAGLPFGALDATERLQLLADLAALP